MKNKNNIRFTLKTRMLFLILSTTIAVFVIAVGYIGLSSRQMAYKNAINNTNSVSTSSALVIESRLNKSMDAIRTLAQAFSYYDTWPKEKWQEYVKNMYEGVYKNNPQLYKLWDSWEMSMVDSGYNMPYGRYAHTYYRLGNEILFSSVTRSLDGDPPLYAKIKKEARESIWEPYWDVFSEAGESKKFMTSMSVPIKKEGQYVGIVALDITMDHLQKIVSGIKPMKNSYAVLISNEGTYIGHPDTAAIGKKIVEYIPGFNGKYKISENIFHGNHFSYTDIDPLTGIETYNIYKPIQIGETNTPWAIGISVPIKVIMEEANFSLLVTVLVTLLGLILLSTIIYVFASRITRPLTKATDLLKLMEKGQVEDIEEFNIDRKDEIGAMSESLNMVTNGLIKTAKFAEEIGKGNLDAEFILLSEKDMLGNALLEMRKSLKHAEEEEERRRLEEEKQRWSTNGIAKFSEILRKDNDNLDQLAFNVMSNLVAYLGAIQGALFVINDQKKDEVFYELKSAIAYDRRRYQDKKIEIGHDLVGRCAHEKKTIYMTDVPDDYVEITSGLGTANPRSILIVPALLNESVYAVIEIASFNVIDDYKIEFVEKIGESIASTISSVKVNERTQRLLTESQHQREELSSQEEEMRQNLEELQATQEEAGRREFELRGLINALSSSTYTIEYDLDGEIIDANEQIARLVGLTREQVIGMNHRDGIDFTEITKEQYGKFWEDLRHGIQRTETNKITFNEREVFLQETYTPIVDQDEKVYKILKIGFDITKLVATENELKEKATLLAELEQRTADQEKELAELKKLLNDEKARNKIILEDLKQQQITKSQADKEKTVTKEEKTERTITLPKPGEKLIEFTNEMTNEIKELDEQHRKIVELMNAVYENLVSGTAKKQTKESIKMLIDYSSWHFSNEEQYFEQYNYEHTEKHSNAHKEFIKQISDFEKDYSSGKRTRIDEIALFAKKWLEEHFSEMDKDYVSLFKSEGL